MTSHTSALSEEMLREPGDFSLVLGGPLFQLLRRSHLSCDALELVCRRLIIIPLLAWLPLLALSALAVLSWAMVFYAVRRGNCAGAVNHCSFGTTLGWSGSLT